MTVLDEAASAVELSGCDTLSVDHPLALGIYLGRYMLSVVLISLEKGGDFADRQYY
jgi:hypothetical protein